MIALGVIALSPVSPIRGIDLSHELQASGLDWLTYTQLESFANVLLFVPFGLLIAMLVPARRWWLVILGLIAVACCIELGQALFLPRRVPSIDDVLANSAGGVAGVVIAAGIRGLVRLVRKPIRPTPSAE